ncbi:hypothetical protein [Thioflexithrix psekupsensis]|uniref:Uncharacterized protein n=1 Tax=Thioflexithrix psekupsensis TaxID=1570016 RepID=A0A251X723_9GAMM|nr:hypothetical protein [Thioflexithrix psekupsensis]OUD12892.1 hypothetical protein TPSD3_12165 [Thioflexithrix psekupsensis]
MQSKIEWLEVFFASYYAGALAYYLSYGWFSKGYSSAGTLFWAVFVGAVAMWGLKPWDHEHGHGEKNETEKPSFIRKHILPISGIGIGIVFAIWLAVGFVSK